MSKKKILIITLYGNFNFGNKLQNYALQDKLKSLNFEVDTLVYKHTIPLKLRNIKSIIIEKINKLRSTPTETLKEKEFIKFNEEYLNFKKEINTYYKVDENTKNDYDYYVYGSDQIWNPYYLGYTPLFMGELTDKNKNITYAASFGISELSNDFKERYKEGLKNFKYISVREKEGKKIVDELVEKKEAKVLVDPTLLLEKQKWEKIMKKPAYLKNKKYILECFLGELSDERQEAINKTAKEYKCEIINLFDKNTEIYNIGPSEFLYLEKNAFLICTDSFHSCVFSLLFDVPFVVFEREAEKNANMYSRIENLLNTFKLKNRKYNGKNITKDNLNHDYQEAYKILEKERKKSDEFLRKSLNVENDI